MNILKFSYYYLIEQLYEQMDNIDGLIGHAGGDPSEMSDQEKVKSIFLEFMALHM